MIIVVSETTVCHISDIHRDLKCLQTLENLDFIIRKTAKPERESAGKVEIEFRSETIVWQS
jgi:hypothetical protein